MSKRRNQHFVPQYYFRLFSKGDPRINVFLKDSERIINSAGIRGQCARKMFYGSREVELLFATVEARHSRALRTFVELGQSVNATLSPHDLAAMLEAVVFQRSRTALECNKHLAAERTFFLEMFKEHLRRSGIAENSEILEALASGKVSIDVDETPVVLDLIKTAIESVVLISDLDFHVLRNETDYPFIFGDSPVVFANTLYHDVRERGVLGYQTPGLQVFYPLDSRTLFMLIDESTYSGRYTDALVLPVTERCDVSQLNALQLHSSLSTIYFASSTDAEYVRSLWTQHKSQIVPPAVHFVKRPDWTVKGAPSNGTLYQMFERPPNIRLALSFVDCVTVPASAYKFRRRSPELFNESEIGRLNGRD